MLGNVDGEMIARIVAMIAAAAVLAWGLRRRRSGAYEGGILQECERKTEYSRFTDVAANEEAKRSLESLAEYLKAPEKYEKMGARMPRGVLLYGPPGTGKTLLARSLAGEADVPFYSLSGSDFVEMYAGVGASRVRALFRKAHKAGRAVIFIDEIDALGKTRGGDTAGERDQTLNALLTEMSALRREERILVVAATNRAEMLDPALLRPGRFDRRIEVGLPDREERLAILRLHARNKPLAGDVNLDRVAEHTVRFSGAALESLLNEAAIRAAEDGRGEIGAEDVERAYVCAVAGEDRAGGRPGKRDMIRVAAHEAGHALAARLLARDKQIVRVSVLPTTRGAGGYNLAVGRESNLWTRERFLAEIDVLLAGRAAEEAILGREEISSGASDDLARAAELAAAMTAELALDGERAVSLRALGRALGCGMEGAMDRCRALLEDRYERTVGLMQENEERLNRLGMALLERETMTGDQVDDCIFGAQVEEKTEVGKNRPNSAEEAGREAAK